MFSSCALDSNLIGPTFISCTVGDTLLTLN
ncbi:exosporium leader peptide-containing protein, partial [Staphylococcus aureus]